MTVRTDVRLPDDLHAIVVAAAQERRVSMNQVIVEGLRQAYGGALDGAGRDGDSRGATESGREPGKVAPPAPSSACPMQVPKGTKCKSCGKVH